jgi:hypothetical protein
MAIPTRSWFEKPKKASCFLQTINSLPSHQHTQSQQASWALNGPNEPNEPNPLGFPRRSVGTVLPISLTASHKTITGRMASKWHVLALLPKTTNCAYLGARNQGTSEVFATLTAAHLWLMVDQNHTLIHDGSNSQGNSLRKRFGYQIFIPGSLV